MNQTTIPAARATSAKKRTRSRLFTSAVSATAMFSLFVVMAVTLIGRL